MPNLLEPLRQCADEIRSAIEGHQGRGYSGQRDTQYHLDLAADAVAVRLLTGAGFGVISEESGVSGSGEYTVVIDPIDGSTNCDRGIPFYCTSLAVLRDGELVAGLVRDQVTGATYEAEVGAGATKDGAHLSVSTVSELSQAVCTFSGYPDRHLGWMQMRAMGASALEICLVAAGAIDLFGVAQHSSLHPWDYLGGLLILREAGGVAHDYHNEALVTAEMNQRHPVFACTTELLDAVREIGVI